METNRPKITLQPVQPDDLSLLHALISANRAFLRTWHPWVETQNTVEDTKRLLEAWLRQMQEHSNIFLGIRVTDTLCGILGTSRIDWQNRSIWLNYWLSEESQGRGIMTHACQIFLGAIFGTLKFNRATIECVPRNKKSSAVAHRLGFKTEGTLREVEWLHDHFEDHVIYGLLRSDWLALHPVQSLPSPLFTNFEHNKAPSA